MGVTTYIGIVRDGQIALIEPASLPEGSPVYVVVPGAIDERTARRKANRWLVEHVGNMLMADQPTLTQSEGKAVWRFGAYATSLSHASQGPVGYVEVDTATGLILNSGETAEKIIQHGEHLERPSLPAEG